MRKPPDYKWVCRICYEELWVDKDIALAQGSEKCPECGSEMVGSPIVHRGPIPDDPFKKY